MLSSKYFTGSTTQLSCPGTDLRDIKSLADELRICISHSLQTFSSFHICNSCFLLQKWPHVHWRETTELAPDKYCSVVRKAASVAHSGRARGMHTPILGANAAIILHTSGMTSKRQVSHCEKAGESSFFRKQQRASFGLDYRVKAGSHLQITSKDGPGWQEAEKNTLGSALCWCSTTRSWLPCAYLHHFDPLQPAAFHTNWFSIRRSPRGTELTADFWGKRRVIVKFTGANWHSVKQGSNIAE